MRGQLPWPGELFLDHVGHFVPDPEPAQAAVHRYGFVTTSLTAHRTPGPGGTTEPTGTGNFCIMLRRGYIEASFATCDSPLASELRTALSRYCGVHLVASASAEAEHTRLQAQGFRIRPLAHLQRPTSGGDVATFTIARVSPGEMPEGRIQFVTHHSPELVWRPEWLAHPNGAEGLLDVIIVVEDLEEAFGRYTRFVGRVPVRHEGMVEAKLERGSIWLAGPAASPMLDESELPALPVAIATAVQVHSLLQTADYFKRNGITSRQHGGCLCVPYPPELGVGSWYFVEGPYAVPWRAEKGASFSGLQWGATKAL